MSSVVVLSHQGIAHELGHLETWLDDHGLTVTRRYRERATALPDADLLIAMGSPWSVAADRSGRDVASEISMVRDWVERDRPYLGICFGAQVLSAAFGGSVERLATPFHGYAALDVPGEEAADPLRGPWVTWHNDGIRAPQDAHVAARLDHADLAFRVRRAWGVQPHVEVDPGILERMAVSLGARPDVYRPIVESLREDRANPARAARLLDALVGDMG